MPNYDGDMRGGRSRTVGVTVSNGRRSSGKEDSLPSCFGSKSEDICQDYCIEYDGCLEAREQALKGNQ